MASKDELQTLLKEKYGINKNISQTLDKAECERLLAVLSQEPCTVKLAEAFAEKNSSLGRNNAYYSRMRNQAETKLENLKAEYQELEAAIQNWETTNAALEAKRNHLEQQGKQLEAELEYLTSKNTTLETKVTKLTSNNQELTQANDQLKKDNKALKNLIDQIKLRLAIDMKNLLKYEDSEIRKAILRMFKSTLG